jgi:hypothetical protein
VDKNHGVDVTDEMGTGCFLSPVTRCKREEGGEDGKEITIKQEKEHTSERSYS